MKQIDTEKDLATLSRLVTEDDFVAGAIMTAINNIVGHMPELAPVANRVCSWTIHLTDEGKSS